MAAARMEVDDDVNQAVARFLMDIETRSVSFRNQFGEVEERLITEYPLPTTHADNEIMRSQPLFEQDRKAFATYKDVRAWLLEGRPADATVQVHDVLLFPMIASMARMAPAMQQLGLLDTQTGLPPAVATLENAILMVQWIHRTFVQRSQANRDYMSIVLQTVVIPGFDDANAPTLYATNDIYKDIICIPIYELGLQSYFDMQGITRRCFLQYVDPRSVARLLARLALVTDPMITLKDLNNPRDNGQVTDNGYRRAIVVGIAGDYGAFVFSMMGMEDLRHRPGDGDPDMMNLMDSVYSGNVGPTYTSDLQMGGRTTGVVIDQIVNTKSKLSAVNLNEAENGPWRNPRDFVLTRMLYFAVLGKSTLTMLNGIAPDDLELRLHYISQAVELWARLKSRGSSFAEPGWGVDLLLYAIHRDVEGPVVFTRIKVQPDGKQIKESVPVVDAFMGAVIGGLPSGRLPLDWVSAALMEANQTDTQMSTLVLSTLKKYGAIDPTRMVGTGADGAGGRYLSELTAESRGTDIDRIQYALKSGSPLPRQSVASRWEATSKSLFRAAVSSVGEAANFLFEPTPEEQARRQQQHQEQQRRRVQYMQQRQLQRR